MTTLAVGIIFLGVQVRFANLNLPMWADETAQVEIARGLDPATGKRSVARVWQQHQQRLGELPAFTLMLHYWLLIEDSVVWSRTLPAVISLASLVYVYKIGRRLKWKKPVALLMTAVVAVSWPFVHYAEEVRIYAVSMLATWVMIYYLGKFWQTPNNSNGGKLTAVHLVGIWSHYGHWLFIPIIFGVLWWKNKWSGRYLLIMVLTCGFLGWNQLRFHQDGFGVDYVARFKLDYVGGIRQKAAMAIKQNYDLVMYAFGVTPWYKDADYFPFDNVATGKIYYLALMGLLVLAGIVIWRRGESLIWGGLLFYILLLVNGLSLWGKYPIGPVRMSLFYMPVIVVVFFQFVNAAIKKMDLLAVVTMGIVAVVIINNLVRLIRVPQRHIGLGIILEMKRDLGQLV